MADSPDGASQGVHHARAGGTFEVLARGGGGALHVFALLGLIRFIAELHAWGYDVPDIADFLAVGVARLVVFGVVVERNVVIGHLLRPVGAVNRAQGARDTRRQHHAVRGRDRWPGCRAIVVAGAFASRHILGEEIDRHPFGIGQEGSELLRESNLHAGSGYRGSLARSGRVWPVVCARRNDEPPAAQALAVRIAWLVVLSVVVERDVVVSDLLRPIRALDGGQLAWHAGRQRHAFGWSEGWPRLG